MSASTATYDTLEPNFTLGCNFDRNVGVNRTFANVFLIDLYTVHFELLAVDEDDEVVDRALLKVSGSILANGNLGVKVSINKSSNAWDFIQLDEIETLMDAVHSFNTETEGSQFDLSCMLHSLDGDLSDYEIESRATAQPLLH